MDTKEQTLAKAREYYKKWKELNWEGYYEKNKEKRIQNALKWRKTEKGRAYSIKYQIEVVNKSKKGRARLKVLDATRSGRLVKQPCEVCGIKKVHAHHDNYDKPLSVRWLCKFHHNEVHGFKNRQ